MRKIKVCCSVTVILLIALAMLMMTITATVVIKTPRYGPTCEDLPTYTGYTYVEYHRYTEDELNEIGEECGQTCVYVEEVLILEEKPQPNEPFAAQGVHIYEFTNDIAAKRVYETFYKEYSLSDYDPIGIDIGDEGVSCYQKRILFRTGRFFVDVGMEYFGEDIARITEQNIEIATAPPTARSTPAPAPQLEKDSDGDGVPDKYDYAPNDPNVQTKSDIKTPGFRATFAIGGLLAVAYLVLRRRG